MSNIDNFYEDDEMFTEPNESDIPLVEYFYDDHYDESMDGDHESGLASAGWGTEEDYGDYGDDDFYAGCEYGY